MNHEPIPIIVLGGSDRKPARLPEAGRDKHPLTGYKGMRIRIDGRPLIELIVERLERSGAFGPIYIAGPRRVYAPLGERVEIVDTDGSFGDNIKAALESTRMAHPGRPVAFITCDVLPEAAELSRLVGEYRQVAPCDLWFPLVRIPESTESLGTSAWKPAYRIVPDPGRPAVPILPGHLVLTDPSALRRHFLYRLFELGYRTRNRPIDSRRGVMIRSLMLGMLYQDLLHLFSFRLPGLTWSVLRAAIPAARLLREGTITRQGLERALRKIFVRYRHRRRHPERRILLPIIDDLSLARDIDTEEEAREIGGNLEHSA